MTMAESLNFTGGDLFLNGEKIFSIPIKHASKDTVTCVGFWEQTKDDHFPVIYVGSGTCCHGHLYKLAKYSAKGPYLLSQIISVDTNLMDILPVSVNYQKAGFPNSDGVMVVGHGCAGAGVRLVSTYDLKIVDVVSAEQYHLQIPCSQLTFPHFRVDKFMGTIHLDFSQAGWRMKAGMRRDPAFPSLLVDTRTMEFHVSSDLGGTMDLTPRLEEVGVNLSKTLELISDYQRLPSR